MGYLPRYRENTHTRNRTRDSLKWRRILLKLPDLTKSPSEKYKLSVCIKGSCTTCIQAALYNFYGLYLPQLCARSFKEEETEEKEEEEDGENRGFCVFRI